MSEFDIPEAEEKVTAVVVQQNIEQKPKTIWQERNNTEVIDEALGIMFDEYARLCQKVGVSALNTELHSFQQRALQIEARWEKTTNSLIF